jgi:uncharacterized protein YbjT (DUF2867 family)
MCVCVCFESSNNQVFVAGGSKGVGRETVAALRKAGKEVVALVRTSEAAADLEGLGATSVVGDAFVYKVRPPSSL